MTGTAPLDAGSMPPAWSGSPLGVLVRSHNLGETPEVPPAPRILIATCMDSRIALRIPPGFAFLLRAAGADLRAAEFDVAVAVATRGIRTIAVVTHTDCAMARAAGERDPFISGLRAVGWTEEEAAGLFDRHAAAREIGDEAAFAAAQAADLRAAYPSLEIEPLLYRVEDGRLYRVVASG